MKINTSDFQYQNKEKQRECMWWGKGCCHCLITMNKENTTYCVEKNGYGYQRCDKCYDECGWTEPCPRWSPAKVKFFVENGFIDHGRFDSNGKLRPFTGLAAKYFKE